MREVIAAVGMMVGGMAFLGLCALGWADMARAERPNHFTGDMYRWAIEQCGGPFKKLQMLETLEVELTCQDGTLHRYYAGHRQ